MIIPNFPSDLLEEHRRWHHINHVSDNDNPPIGWGDRFLSFHRQYIRKVLDWYRGTGLDMALVAPWTEVPQGIRMSSCYDANAEMRIRYQPQSFATSDELGRYMEHLHACIHDAGSVVLNEHILEDLDVAPLSTYFYQIHGMIDNWYSNWERTSGQISGGFPGVSPGGAGPVPGLLSSVAVPARRTARKLHKAGKKVRKTGSGSARKQVPGAARKSPVRRSRKR